jgi:AcrR family transcriptional regulator
MYLLASLVKRKRMRRMSRTETQAQTRQRLLDAAERAFAAEGFTGASLDRIAEAAGFTRGAVYSNFADKTDLFVAVLDRRLDRRSAEVAEVMQAASTPDAFIAALRNPPWLTPGSEDETRRWLMLRQEFGLFALRHPAAAERLARHDRRERDYYVQAMTHLLGQLGVEPPANPLTAAAILLALDEGLVRQHCIDPDEVPATAMADAVELLLDAAVALAASRPRRRRAGTEAATESECADRPSDDSSRGRG